MKIRWVPSNEVELIKDLHLAKFKLDGVITGDCTRDFYTGNQLWGKKILSCSNYSSAAALGFNCYNLHKMLRHFLKLYLTFEYQSSVQM